MTIQTLLPFLIGFFIGGILTEIRWMQRLRRLQGEGYPYQRAEGHHPSIEESVRQGPAPEIHSLPGLRALRDQLVAETEATPTAQLKPTAKP
jgi:hypothetical protein